MDVQPVGVGLEEYTVLFLTIAEIKVGLNSHGEVKLFWHPKFYKHFILFVGSKTMSMNFDWLVSN